MKSIEDTLDRKLEFFKDDFQLLKTQVLKQQETILEQKQQIFELQECVASQQKIIENMEDLAPRQEMIPDTLTDLRKHK